MIWDNGLTLAREVLYRPSAFPRRLRLSQQLRHRKVLYEARYQRESGWCPSNDRSATRQDLCQPKKERLRVLFQALPRKSPPHAYFIKSKRKNQDFSQKSIIFYR